MKKGEIEVKSVRWSKIKYFIIIIIIIIIFLQNRYGVIHCYVDDSCYIFQFDWTTFESYKQNVPLTPHFSFFFTHA